MNNTKIFFTLVILFLAGCTTGQQFSTSAGQVAATAAEIADFEPPSGFRPDFCAHVMGYTVAAYQLGDGHSHLYLIQTEDEIDGEQLEHKLSDLVPGSHDRQTRLTVVETRAVSLRGEQRTLVLSEGTNSEGEPYRQAAVSFSGKGGAALLVITQPTNRWDWDTLDDFLASIQ